MATTFAADWSKAKAAFTSATNAKKPSATFLGVFNKGPGISSALKAADAATNVGELNSAMKTFKSAFDEYVKTLDKAISDPKVTDPGAKPAYIAAAAKLKKDLLDIYTRAGVVAQSLVGEKKKTAVSTTDLKAQAEERLYEAAKGRIAELIKVNRSTRESRGRFDEMCDTFAEQIGNLIASKRPKGESGGRIEDFEKDPEVKKLCDQARGIFANREKNHLAYHANREEAVKVRDSLAEAHKPELESVTSYEAAAPLAFAAAMEKELAKKAGKRESEKVAEAADKAFAGLNPQHLAAKAGELSKLYDLLFASCTAAVKSAQVGGADRAKVSLTDAQSALQKMDAIVTQIKKDYEAQKSSVSTSKDRNDILAKLVKINALHQKAVQDVAAAKSKVG